MAFWKRRKTIYSWDDNFVPTAELGELGFGHQGFNWVCPENQYVEMIAMHIVLFITTGVHQIDFYLDFHSAQHRYYRYILGEGLGDDRTLHFYLITSGACRCAGLIFTPMYHWLPFNTRLIPGDNLRFVIEGAPAVNDHLQRYAVRYNRWDLD
jgi:hypothetical protein